MQHEVVTNHPLKGTIVTVSIPCFIPNVCIEQKTKRYNEIQDVQVGMCTS